VVTEPGTRIAEAYEVEKHLGHGAMGDVVAAIRTADQTRVAIKMLRP